MIQIGKGVFLKFFVFRLPDAGAEAQSRPGRVPGIEQAADQGQQSADRHEQPLVENIGDIPAGHSQIDNVGHDQRE